MSVKTSETSTNTFTAEGDTRVLFYLSSRPIFQKHLDMRSFMLSNQEGPASECYSGDVSQHSPLKDTRKILSLSPRHALQKHLDT